ncbi:MAG: tetratricopeptide repeat protein [Kiritimatiellia bacterium]
MLTQLGILKLPQRLIVWLPIPAIIATVAFFSSLSHHVCPGQSATLIAAAAGVIPPSGIVYPAFAMVTRAMASLEIYSLPLRMNMLAAICGTLCAMLIYHLTAKAILLCACEDVGGLQAGYLPQDKDFEGMVSFDELPPEVIAYNRKIFLVAVVGGLTAALVLIFTAPGWLASTRLEGGMFHLVLVLCAASLFPHNATRFYNPQFFLSTFLFALGIFESAVFILLLPCFLYFLFKVVFLSDRRVLALSLAVAAGVAALLLSIYFYQCNLSGSGSYSLRAILSLYAHQLPFHHWRELCSFLPRLGWIPLLLQTVTPACIIMFGSQTLFKYKGVSSVVGMYLVGASVIPVLLNLRFSPFFILTQHPPVFSSAITAIATAFVIASALITIDNDPYDSDVERSSDIDIYFELLVKKIKISASALLLVLTICLLITPWRSHREVSLANSGFADQTAAQMLAIMNQRTILVTNGLLDNHLLIQAFGNHQQLTLIPLDPHPDRAQINRLAHLIETHPLFEDSNHIRLKNALSLGIVPLVLEWLKSDKTAGEHVMIFATPELWTGSGFTPIPEGLAFGGVPAESTLSVEPLYQQNMAFYKNILPLLKEVANESEVCAYLRRGLQIKAGFCANEFGILLENMSMLEKAYQVYTMAAAGDPSNVSVAVNLYFLTANHQLYPEALDSHKKQVQIAMENVQRSGIKEFDVILQNFGSINQKEFYLQQTRAWANRGARKISREKIGRALALSKHTGIPALLEKALVDRHVGAMEQAESCYRAVLNQDPANTEALIGLCTVLISTANTDEAQKWLQRAVEAGIKPEHLRYQAIAVAILRGNRQEAFELLQRATKEQPTDLRYWTMLADILLAEDDTRLVELQVLAGMQKALNNADHFLVHAVRGQMLRKKGVEFYRDARLELLKALTLNAELPGIWNVVLELDMAINNPIFQEADARSLLAINPDHAFANYLMGSVLLAYGVLPQSEDFLRRSIENKPTAMAYNDLAENLRRQAKFDEAENLAKRSIAMDAQLLPVLDTLACVFFDKGRFEESAKFAAQAVAANPKNIIYQLTLLRAQAKLGDRQGVKQRLEAIPDHDKNITDDLKKEIQAL